VQNTKNNVVTVLITKGNLFAPKKFVSHGFHHHGVQLFGVVHTILRTVSCSAGNRVRAILFRFGPFLYVAVPVNQSLFSTARVLFMMLSRAVCRVACALRTRAAAPTVRQSSASAAAALNKHLQAQMDEMKKAGTFKVERVITSAQAASITVQERPNVVINLCANNYLGLSNDPELVAEAKHTLDTHGFGLSSVRFICGTQDIHKKLESLISEFHGTEDTILFPSCFDANAAIFEAVLTPEDAIITDSLNHASIIDGIRLCKAQKYIYKHLDLADMRAKLEEAKTKGSRFRWIVTDGAFSMDGDIAPLDEIKKLADECVDHPGIRPPCLVYLVGVGWSFYARAGWLAGSSDLL
jgi:hypothetical protein